LFNNLPRSDGQSQGGGIDRTFGNNSWEVISECSNLIEEYRWTDEQIAYNLGWYPGDTKAIIYTGWEGVLINLMVRILGFRHDTKVGGGRAGISLEVAPLTALGTETSNINTGGWTQSWSRNTLMPYQLNRLPSDLTAVIKPAVKVGSNGSQNPNPNTNNDTLWLLSAAEIGDTSTPNGAVVEGETYAFYRMMAGIPGMGRNKIQSYGNNIGGPSLWWTRSVVTANANPWRGGFRRVAANGTLENIDSMAQGGVSFGFCV
jgi:hypothetical protein